MVYLVIIIISLIALAFVGYNFFKLRSMKEGNEDMIELAGIIRAGARTFMRAEYKRIIPAIVIVGLLISLFIEKTCGLTFVLGATMSSLACVIGMRSATYANVRTAHTAAQTKNIGKTTQTALRGGSISGLSVPAFGLFGLVLICAITGGVQNDATGTGLIATTVCNPTVMRLTTYSLGCSLVALFNRVAGGNYTKAADISADIVAKIRHDMPEDDSRMPNTVADFIGDNVNDIAGNCSDLLESFVATISACLLIAGTIAGEYKGSTELFNATVMFPIIIAGTGLFTRPLVIHPENSTSLPTFRPELSSLAVSSLRKSCLVKSRSTQSSAAAGLHHGLRPYWVLSLALPSVKSPSTTLVPTSIPLSVSLKWQQKGKLLLSRRVMQSAHALAYCPLAQSALRS